MRLELILNSSLIKRHYGNVPDTYGAPEGAYESYTPNFEANDYKDDFDLDFVEPVNALCHSLIDRGDVDYLDASQCELLVPWLEKRLKRPCPHPLDCFYSRLLEYARRASELGTGVVLDL